ncbi:MAG: MATE family efflux transporter [Lachnospirales bacterium]
MERDLTKGNAKKQILLVSLPVIMSSFIKMLNTFIDMFWLKNIGDSAVAAVGVAGLLTWFFIEVGVIAQLGSQVRVSTEIGARNKKKADVYGKNAFFISVILGIFILILTNILARPFMNMYEVTEIVGNYGVEYLRAVSIGLPFMFCNFIFDSIYQAKGNTKTPFIINGIATGTNMILDPIFIFTLNMGVFGAGLATAFASVIGFTVYFLASKGIFDNKHFKPEFKICKELIKVGFPNFIYKSLFTFTSMFVAGVVVTFGTSAVAVQQIGVQLEAVSWMTSGGLSVAISSFVGQNVGANKYNRILKGYNITMVYAIVLGIMNTLLFFFAGGFVISLFLNEPESLIIGTRFMKISSISQLFMCIEIVTIGAFLGLSKPMVGSISNAVFTVIRVPLIMVLSREDVLGLDGVWVTIVISCFLKGIVSTSLFYLTERKKIKKLAKIELETCET